jgi:predicted LPLAT superfamily acyltransferase
MTRAAAQDWSASKERSNPLAIRTMAWVALRLGRPVARLVLHPIALYFLLFAPGPRRHGARYLERVLGRRPRWAERYRHFHAFASVVLDRLYFVRGEMSRFDVKLEGAEFVDRTLEEGRGAFLLGAHVGSFEALHTVGTSRPGLRVAMVMYPANARLIHGVLQAVAPDFQLGIIAIGQRGSTLQIRDWLDDGGLAGLLGDRFMPNEAGRTVDVPFLGRPAPFSEGPLKLALLLKRRVIFMSALYLGGRRYHVRFEPLVDFRDVPDDREAALRKALEAYVARLEALCREAPYNWFNFHDFWHEDV